MKEQKHTILIVVDDADHRFLAQRTFESLGTKFKVQLAKNGEQAIAYLKGEGPFADRSKYEFPSYMLVDLNMAPGDGFDVLEFIKTHPALSVVPVVMMSNSAHPDDIRQAYLLGASSFILKPSTIDDFKILLKAIHTYWAQCEVPEVDTQGYAVATDDFHRPGARYTKPARAAAGPARAGLPFPARRPALSADSPSAASSPPLRGQNAVFSQLGALPEGYSTSARPRDPKVSGT